MSMLSILYPPAVTIASGFTFYASAMLFGRPLLLRFMPLSVPLTSFGLNYFVPNFKKFLYEEPLSTESATITTAARAALADMAIVWISTTAATYIKIVPSVNTLMSSVHPHAASAANVLLGAACIEGLKYLQPDVMEFVRGAFVSGIEDVF